jgi:aquaporin Z
VAVFLGAGRAGGSRTVAPVAVGLSFAALLQVGQSVGNLPFNPARAVASAVFSSSWAVEQLWVFLVAPLAGAAIAGLVFRIAAVAESAPPVEDGEASDGGRSGGEAADGHDVDEDSAEADDEALESAGKDDVVPAPGAQQDKAGHVSEAQEFFDGKRS